ncbi:MAG: SDR family oxidoreductase [Gammaproteobacteria bacterium]|nr:MAG: SDR family oxidoreductase [Gammaproteobacteria bacterium]
MTKGLAIVTGAGRGIGKAIAQRLKADGFQLLIADLDAEAGEQAASELDARFLKCNVGDENSVAQLFKAADGMGSPLHVVVNNAGIIRDGVIWKLDSQDFDLVINVNLRGTWLMCREAAIRMRQQGYGRIINIASRAWLGNPGQTNYSASKAGVIGLTRALALELARKGVTVNAVAPGLIDTPMTRNLPEEVRQKLINSQPGKNIGSPKDVADAVAFLASEENGFINGQVIHVDGGKSISTLAF